MSDTSQPNDPTQGEPNQADPTAGEYAGAGPDDTVPQAAARPPVDEPAAEAAGAPDVPVADPEAASDAGGSRWEPTGEETEVGVGGGTQAAPQPVPMTAHLAGDPTPGEAAAAAGSATWAGRLGLRGDGSGPSPWARRIGLAGAAAALVAVGGVAGYAVGNAGGDGDRFSPTSFQVDRDGDNGFRGDRHERGDHHGFGEEGLGGDGFPGQGDGYGVPGDGQADQSDSSGTTT